MANLRDAHFAGTDLHIYEYDDWAQSTIPVPMIIGHEWVGTVEEIGDNAFGLQVGDRVTGEGHVTCQMCRNCRAGRRHLCRNTVSVGVNRPGAFAEYLVFPAKNAFKLPQGIPAEVASFMDPLGNAIHSAISFDLVGEDVLITGAGPIGCMAAAVCQHVGARFVVVTDTNDYRLDLARQCGADLCINVSGKDSRVAIQEAMRDLGMTEGFDVALEMSGVQSAYTDIVSSMNHGGRVALLGIPGEKAFSSLL